MNNEQLRSYRAGLTRREVEVFQLIAAGKCNKGIAEALSISIKTVETHVANIYDKIGVKNRTQAVVWLFASAPA